MMKSIRLLLPLSCVVALALAGCVGPTPTVAPNVTVPPNTPLPEGYPAAASPVGPNEAYPAAVTPTAATVFITYQDFVIVPAQQTIKVGTRVTFLIRSASGSFHQPFNFTPPNTFEAPPELGDGTSFSFTFNEAGTITILCGYHEADMRASLTIEP
jgi:plastocyanin